MYLNWATLHVILDVAFSSNTSKKGRVWEPERYDQGRFLGFLK